jgi:endoglucanase
VGSGGGGGRATGSGGGSSASGGSPGGGLIVDDNRILLPNGSRFHGRGANLNDTRSCEACSWQEPDVAGLNRWTDELIDNWGANFIRFNLWAFADDGGFRQQWRSIADDSGYRDDVRNTVTHMTDKPGVYVMVTVFLDPSIKPDNGDYDSEWPTEDAIPVYETIAEIFADDPKVLIGLTNEPHGPADRNAELAGRYLDAIDAIRATEERTAGVEHTIAVQAPQQWSRYLDYFVENPIQRDGIVYEVHVYNPESDFDDMLDAPSRTLPIIVGEYGPSQYSSDSDVRALWTRCRSLEIPHIAWTFHMRCPPNLLEDTASDGCGLSASTGFNFPRTSWGDMLYDYLAMPW